MWLLFKVIWWQIEKKNFLYSIYTVWLKTRVTSLAESSPETTPANYFLPGYLAISQKHSEKAQNEQVIPWLSELWAANPDPTWRLTSGMGLFSYPGWTINLKGVHGLSMSAYVIGAVRGPSKPQAPRRIYITTTFSGSAWWQFDYHPSFLWSLWWSEWYGCQQEENWWGEDKGVLEVGISYKHQQKPNSLPTRAQQEADRRGRT